MNRDTAVMDSTHGRLVLHWLSVLVIGKRRLVLFSRQRRPDRTVGGEPFVLAPLSERQVPLTLG